MNEKTNLVDKLFSDKKLSIDEYTFLLKYMDDDTAMYLKQLASIRREQIYNNKIFIRGLIEISNYCKNNCLYCGIRKDNSKIKRYRLTKEEILSCCDKGYDLGFRTFVLQGGEDPYYSDDLLVDIIKEIKSKFDNIAITLCLGERSYESYKKLYDAGANRYLLRHETADKEHYSLLHSNYMDYNERFRCLNDLKDIGYQVGCGFMVGSPHQTYKTLAKDLKFIEEFSPDMCGIGPYISHKDTPFRDYFSGDVKTTYYLLSIIRLIKPEILLPATTAVATLDIFGRENAVLCGANVIMPNLSPKDVKSKYEIYENKVCFGDESAENIDALKERMNNIGFEIVVDKGDIKNG